MRTGKQRYDERRALEHDNETRRLRMQGKSYDKQNEADEVAVLALQAVRAFLEGRAAVVVTNGARFTSVRFEMREASDE